MSKTRFASTLWGVLRTKKTLLFVVSITALIASLLTVIPPLLVREIIDGALPDRDLRSLLILSVGLLAGGVIAKVLDFVKEWLEAQLGSQLHFELSCQLFDSLQHKRMEFHANTATGEKIQKLINAFSIEMVIVGVYTPLLTFSVILTSSIVLMLILDWRLAAIGIALLVPVIALSTLAGPPIRRLSAELIERQGDIFAFAFERLQRNGIIHLAALNLGLSSSQEFKSLAAPLVGLNARRAIIGALPGGLTGASSVVIMVLAFGLGGFLVLQGSVTLGSVVAFALISSQILEPAVALVRLPASFSEARAELEPVFELLGPVTVERGDKGSIRKDQWGGEIAFEDVSFRYEDDAPLLNNLSFVIQPNQLVALVGANGVGKTTVAYLLLRLYDVQHGRITIDNVDIRDLELTELCSVIGFLPYEALLFMGTVLDNLRLGNPAVSWERVLEVCQQARIHHVIEAMPEGYHTFIGDGGYELSSGQKQRLALARLLIKGSQVVILDEITASLDTESEEALLSAITELSKTKTIIAIAHNPAMIKASDTVLVLHQGRVVEADQLQAIEVSSGR
jgi:ATP-binding cassette subfamily B protein